jgi:hypothetical protein
LHALDDWQDAPALVLSCPGPLRRHAASVLPLDRLALAQVFLGGESQLLAFAAAFPQLRTKMFFAPLPEMFSASAGLRDIWPRPGRAPRKGTDIIHLRFGSVREARVLKGVRNVAVVAESPCPAVPESCHPFTAGDMLPAGMEFVLTYAATGASPSARGRGALPKGVLPAACVASDPAAQAPTGAGMAGLDLVSLQAFNSAAWAAGAVHEAGAAAEGRCVLIPWNMAQLTSVVPELLARLAAFQDGEAAPPYPVLLPFNNPGQSGMIRALIERLRKTGARPQNLLEHVFLARVSSFGGLAALRRLSARAWVDASDPEAWWTLARLRAAGFAPLVLGAAGAGLPAFPAVDLLDVERQTRFGPLRFAARLPALRDLPALLATAAPSGAPGRPARRA